MTNVIGELSNIKLVWVLVTNCTLTHIQTPVLPEMKLYEPMQMVYYAKGYHENVVVSNNLMMNVEWKGQKKSFVLESVEVSRTNKVTWR